MNLYDSDIKLAQQNRISKFFKFLSYDTKLSSLMSEDTTLSSRVAALKETSFLSTAFKEWKLSTSVLKEASFSSARAAAVSLEPVDFSLFFDRSGLKNLYYGEDDQSVDPSPQGDAEVLQIQTQILTQACQADTQLSKDVFIRNFIKLIFESEFEFGYTTPADDYVESALATHGQFAREWISEVFVKNFSDFSIIIGILRVISHIDYRLMYPQGMTMATAALVHENFEVKECGVRCFENWEAPENINILKSVSVCDDWLNDYVQRVIKDLESINSQCL